MDDHNAFVSEVRYSRDMRLFRAVTLGLGLSLGIGLFLLPGAIIRWTGGQAPLAYLLAGLLFLPLALSLAEWAAVRGAEGLHHLLEATEQEELSYLIGWVLLGGGVALAALLARGGADYLSALAVNLLNLSLPPRWLAPLIALLLTGNNVLGTRENRWVQNTIVLLGLVTLLGLSGWSWPGSPPPMPPSGGETFHPDMAAAIALLSGSMWGLVLILAAGEEMRRAEWTTPRALLAALGLGSIGGAVGAAALWHSLGPRAMEQPLPWADWATQLDGLVLQGWVLALGVVLLIATLNRTLLTLARVGSEMSREGFLPPGWRTTHPQFHTPHRLLTGAGILAALISGQGDIPLLAALVGLAFLALAFLVNLPPFLSRGEHLPEQRPITLPFPPLIPGMAMAISLFLLTALPWDALALGAGWILVGAIWYLTYARRGVVAAREGVTVFRGEPAARVETRYRVLVPLANPATAESLIGAAGAVARARGGEVIALQVVVMPEQTSLRAGQRVARQRWSLLDRAVKRAQAVGVPMHSIVRIARSPVEGILDTAQEEACDLILMGWRGEPTSQTYELGPVIDPVVIQAPCDVVVLKGTMPDRLERILIPTAGGPHAPAAVNIGLDLTAGSKAEVIALNLIRGPVTAEARRQAQTYIDQTLEGIDHPERVSRRIARADEVKQGILEAAARCDLLLLGASEEGLLDQTTFGGLPEEVARACKKPVLLVKRSRGLRQFWLRRAWQSVYALFPSLDRPEQIEVYRAVRRGARPDVDFFVLIVLSSAIATLGLLQNSAAVIIGAMLVAPLMTPILAMSLGIVRGDVRLLRLALESALKGVTLAVVVAVGMALLTPRAELTSEMVARTRPTLLDLIVALASGAAGAYAIGRKEVAAALPGVAIAAALVPPLCVAGAGIALARSDVAGGGLLLFITNWVAISLAGAVVFLLLGFRPAPDERERQRRFWQGLAVSLTLLLAISIPLGVFLAQTVREGQRQQAVAEVLTRQARGLGATLADFDLQREGRSFYVEATLYAPSPPDRNAVKGMQNALSQAIGAPVRLEVVVIPVARVPAE